MNNKTSLIQLRVTPDDKSTLQKKANEAGLSLTELVRDYILNDKTEIIQKEDSIALIYQINKIGNNINQLAKSVNSASLSGKVSDETYESVIVRLKLVSDNLKSLVNIVKLKG